MGKASRSRKILLCCCLCLAIFCTDAFAVTDTGVEDIPLPLSGPAFYFAQSAYQAFKDKDYPTALAKIREAQRLRPDVARLREVEQKILNAQKAAAFARQRAAAQRTKAADLAKAGTRAGKTTEDPAWKAADAAYTAIHKEDTAAAIASAREAVRLAPDRVNYQMLLADTLAQGKHYDEAVQSLTKAIERLGKVDALDARLDVIQHRLAQAPAAAGYKAFGEGDNATAAEQAQRAIALAPDVMAYRLLRIDALLQMKRYAEAEKASSEAMAQDEEDIIPLVLRASIRTQLQDMTGGLADYEHALHLQGLTDDEKRTVSLLAADTALAAGEFQRARDLILPFKGKDNKLVDFRIKKIEHCIQTKVHPDQTAEALTEPVVACRETPYGTACHLSTDQDASGYGLVSAAYKAVLSKNNKEAYDLFSQAREDGSLPPSAAVDAAFAALKVGHNAEAIKYFKRSIDAANAGTLQQTPQQTFETRQAVAEISRTWGAYVYANYRGMNALPDSGGLSGSTGDSLQIGTEMFWRPPVIGYNNGRIFEVYGRVADTAYNQVSEYQGSKTVQAAVGVRYKPINIINFFLSMEREIPLGSLARHDWLSLASYSFDYGTYIRKDKPSWFTAQLGVQAGHYIEQDENIGFFEAKLGRTYRVDPISSNLLFFPHGVIGGDYDSVYTDGKQPAVGAGGGVGLRYYFHEDSYTAPRSHFDTTLQYRFLVAGDSRGRGLFLRSTLYF